MHHELLHLGQFLRSPGLQTLIAKSLETGKYVNPISWGRSISGIFLYEGVPLIVGSPGVPIVFLRGLGGGIWGANYALDQTIEWLVRRHQNMP